MKHTVLSRTRLTLRGLLLFALAGPGGLALLASPAYAHGEKAQEAFIKTNAVAWYNVKFSGDEIKRGERLTLTGTFRVLENWPQNLTLPENTEAYLSITEPGPKLLVEDRQIDGEFVPGRVHLARGKSYDFKVVMIGRTEGRWHIHPIISFKTVGPLIGPGQWVRVKGGSELKNPIQLAGGKTVNLETYGLGAVVGWQLLTILVGAGWLVYWLVPKPLLYRAKLLMTGQNVEEQLVSTRDRRVGLGFAGVSLTIILAGTLMAKSAWPETIPQQIRRHTPAPLVEQHYTTAATEGIVRYSMPEDKITWAVKVTNNGQSPIHASEFTTSTITFGLAGSGHEYPLVAEPVGDESVDPGETKVLTLVMADPVWNTEGLLPLREVSSRIAGLLTFEDAQGVLDRVEINGEITKF